jgi:dsDNA-binding SOS-regulon protein
VAREQDRIDQMLEIEERLKNLITDARGVLKDLKAEKQSVVKYIAAEPKRLIEEEVTKQLGIFGKQTEKAMHDSFNKVISEFDKLRDLLLKGKDKTGPDLETMIRAKVERDKEIG